jgi:hypothetical protein
MNHATVEILVGRSRLPNDTVIGAEVLETLADMAWALDQAVEVRIGEAVGPAVSEVRAAGAETAGNVTARASRCKRPRAGDRLDAD